MSPQSDLILPPDTSVAVFVVIITGKFVKAEPESSCTVTGFL